MSFITALATASSISMAAPAQPDPAADTAVYSKIDRSVGAPDRQAIGSNGRQYVCLRNYVRAKCADKKATVRKKHARAAVARRRKTAHHTTASKPLVLRKQVTLNKSILDCEKLRKRWQENRDPKKKPLNARCVLKKKAAPHKSNIHRLRSGESWNCFVLPESEPLTLAAPELVISFQQLDFTAATLAGPSEGGGGFGGGGGGGGSTVTTGFIGPVVSSGGGGGIFVPPNRPPFTGAVPEPATWMMMVAGIGAMGAALRRRKAVPAGRAL